MKLRIANANEVKISRDGNYALIQFLDGKGGDTNFGIGPDLLRMTDSEILAVYNDGVRATLEHAARWRPIEIAPGSPQIKFDRKFGVWATQGQILRCLIESDYESDEPVIVIDDHRLSIQEFGKMINSFNGWGMRISFVSEDQLSNPPGPVVRKAPKRISKREVEAIAAAEEQRLREWSGNTIEAVVQQFINDKHAASKHSQADKRNAAELFMGCLNSYGHSSLSSDESKRIELQVNAHVPKDFCQIFGPEKIVQNVEHFVSYFLIRKVMLPGDEMGKAALVVADLCKWLVAKEIVPPAYAETAIIRAERAARELPQAEEVNRIIWMLSQKCPQEIDEKHFVDFGTMTVVRILDNRIWLQGDEGPHHGPIVLPKNAAQLLKVNWTINCALAESRGKWYFAEVGNVYPD